MVFTQILQGEGYHFKLASNGREGIEIYRRCKPRLILMDVSMPEMSGLEAARIIRDIEGDTGVRTPIIGVTAHAIKGDKEKCQQAGMDDYLAKPISPDALAAKISRWLNRPAETMQAG